MTGLLVQEVESWQAGVLFFLHNARMMHPVNDSLREGITKIRRIKAGSPFLLWLFAVDSR